MLRAFIAGLAVSLSLLPAYALADNLNITAQEHLACDNDVERLCMFAYPSESKILTCMKANLHRLTPVCLATFEAGMKRRHLNL